MTRCPKCSSDNISGPFYYPRNYGELLMYVCQCGYKETSPCHDAKQEIPDFSNMPAIFLARK